MGNKIKRCISFDTKTDVLIDKIMEISNAQNVSDLFRLLVQQEAVRLGIIQGEIVPTKNEDTDFTELYKKLSMLLTIVKSTDDKLYCLLDSFNSFLHFTEPEASVPYRSIDIELDKNNFENIHSYIKLSQKNLEEKKYRVQLNK